MTVVSENRERNYGVDALRLLSMFFVVILHVMGHGGILDVVTRGSDMYKMAWLLETGAYCAVDCFALISGYVAVGGRFRLSRIPQFWFQVVFWMLAVTAVFAVFFPEKVGAEEWKTALLPITTGVYWYATAYFGLLLLSPLLTEALNVMKTRHLALIGIVSFFVYIILPALLDESPYIFSSGYSMVWLVVLFAFGGIIRRCRVTERVNGWFGLLLYIVCVGVSWYFKINGNGRFVNYVSPTIFLSSVGLLIFFASRKIGRVGAKIIAFFSPAAFGVYLIHVQPLLWKSTVDMTIPFTEKPVLVAALLCLATAAAVFVVCLLLDKLRDGLFRLLRVKKLYALIDRIADGRKKAVQKDAVTEEPVMK